LKKPPGGSGTAPPAVSYARRLRDQLGAQRVAGTTSTGPRDHHHPQAPPQTRPHSVSSGGYTTLQRWLARCGGRTGSRAAAIVGGVGGRGEGGGRAGQRLGGRGSLAGPFCEGAFLNRGAAGKRGKAQTRRRGKPREGQLQHSRRRLGTDNATATSHRAQPRTPESQRLCGLLSRALFRGPAVPGTGWGTAPCLPPYGGARWSPAPVSPGVRSHRLRFAARSRYGVGRALAALGVGFSR
jgi:hypothetical protein